MLGFAIKIDTIPTGGILIEILEELKIDEAKIIMPKTKVLKIGVLTTDMLKIGAANVSIIDDANLVDEGVCNLVYEVEVTSVNDVLR